MRDLRHMDRMIPGRFLISMQAAAACVLISSCTTPPSPEELTRWVAPNIPDERFDDFRLTAYLVPPSVRRSMYTSDDVVEWLDDYWHDLDPTPDTPENEALQVYRQRVSFLLERFPTISFGEWEEPWEHMLLYGLPDSQGPERPPWQVLNLSRRRTGGSNPVWSLNYGTPWDFRVTLGLGREASISSFRRPPGKPPSLEQAWQVLENPHSQPSRKKRALTYLSWYELPQVAERLLQIPIENFEGITDLRQEALHRLAIRCSYLLDPQGIRRAAALVAAGSSPETVLRRAISGDYPSSLFKQDLEVVQDMHAQIQLLERMPNRSANIELKDDPEMLLRTLVQKFPSELSITGWDWRGDLYLAYGSPAYLNENNRIAYYTWGSPEVIGVGSTMLGWIESARVEDILKNFIEIAADEVRNRQQKGRRAALTLGSALRGESSGRRAPSRSDMLEQIHVLAPPPVYQVGLPRGVNSLPMTMDAVAFPTPGDSMEVQVSFGIPTEAVRIMEVEDGYTMSLRTKLSLLDHDLNQIHSTTRYKGYLIEGSPEIKDRFFLDTVRFLAPPGSYIVYLSAEDPDTEISGGALFSLDLSPYGSDGLQVSPILLATDIRPASGSGKFIRGESRILPAPSRYLLYGQDLFFYYEISNLEASRFNDYVWNESYYIIPHSPDEGIITITPDHDYTRLTQTVSRDMQVDLSSLEATYSGQISLVVLVTDLTSQQQAVGVTLFNLRTPRQ
jgi:hypothetical protein